MCPNNFVLIFWKSFEHKIFIQRLPRRQLRRLEQQQRGDRSKGGGIQLKEKE